MNLFKRLFSSGPVIDYSDLICRGALVVDVRAPFEFKSGHIKGSINIPLDQINNNIPALKGKSKPLITVCRSGNRSASARAILEHAGLEVYNGGAWNHLQEKIAKAGI